MRPVLLPQARASQHTAIQTPEPPSTRDRSRLRPSSPLGPAAQASRRRSAGGAARAQGTRTGTAMTRMLEARASCRTAPHLIGSGGAAAEPPARPTRGLAPAPAPAPAPRPVPGGDGGRRRRMERLGRCGRDPGEGERGIPSHKMEAARRTWGRRPRRVLPSPPHPTAPHSPEPPAARASSAAPARALTSAAPQGGPKAERE